jgi:lactate racemase
LGFRSTHMNWGYMPTIKLGYGNDQISFDYSGDRFELLSPETLDNNPLSDAAINAAIGDLIDSPPLEEIISPGESILIIASDATRNSASGQVINLLVRRLISLGGVPNDIRIIFATGIHRPVTQSEKVELLTPFIYQRIKTLDHNAYDPGQMVNLGKTERGTPIEINRALLDYSHVILTGSVSFHYFAGFTGGRKSICPGLASARTIAETHMLALDFEKGGRRFGCGAGRLDGNAVHEECERIAAEVAPSFLINTVTDNQNRALSVYAGDWRMAHRRACAEYADSHVVWIKEKRPLVIVSCGGSPLDINLIQAHKALDMATHACNEGGTIVLIAKCADGMGKADFMKWFESGNSRALEERLRSDYEVNGQTAWALLSKAERFRVYLVSDLDAEDVKRMHMYPVRSIDEAFENISNNSLGYIMPNGSVYLPAVKIEN